MMHISATCNSHIAVVGKYHPPLKLSKCLPKLLLVDSALKYRCVAEVSDTYINKPRKRHPLGAHAAMCPRFKGTVGCCCWCLVRKPQSEVRQYMPVVLFLPFLSEILSEISCGGWPPMDTQPFRRSRLQAMKAMEAM
jgi:hypothetical protein